MNPFMIQWEIHALIYHSESSSSVVMFKDTMFVIQANTQLKARRSILEDCWKRGFYIRRIRQVKKVKK